MKAIIDRFEGSFAVCEKEDREMINIDKVSIPLEAKEGDVLNIIDESYIVIDEEATKKRKNKIKKLTEDLWQ